MREKFSDPEWLDMQVLVFWVLLRVASADGTLSKDEWAEILAAVKRVSASTTLIGQLSASISYAQVPKLSEFASKFHNRVPGVRAMLLERLGTTVYGAFVSGLMAMAVDVARLEGRSDAGLAAHISREEQDVLLKLLKDLS